MAVRIAPRQFAQRLGEARLDEAADARQRRRTVTLAEGVVEEARQVHALLDRAGQALVEAVLRATVHDEIRTGYQQLHWHTDRLRICHDAVGGLVQAQQHAHRDRPGDQRIGSVAFHPRRIVGQPLRLDVAVDEEVAAQLLHQGQASARERHVQLHLERRRSHDQRAQARRVVVHPGGGHHGAHALRDHHDVLHRDAVLGTDVGDEAVQITYQRREARCIAARARRTAVAARIPGKERGIGQVQLIDQVGDPAGMFVAAMQQHDGLGRRGGRGARPVPVEQRYLVEAVEFPFLRLTHAISRLSFGMYLITAAESPLPAARGGRG